LIQRITSGGLNVARLTR